MKKRVYINLVGAGSHGSAKLSKKKSMAKRKKIKGPSPGKGRKP